MSYHRLKAISSMYVGAKLLQAMFPTHADFGEDLDDIAKECEGQWDEDTTKLHRDMVADIVLAAGMGAATLNAARASGEDN